MRPELLAATRVNQQFNFWSDSITSRFHQQLVVPVSLRHQPELGAEEGQGHQTVHGADGERRAPDLAKAAGRPADLEERSRAPGTRHHVNGQLFRSSCR